MIPTASQALHILQVEDNFPDIVLTKKALERGNLACTISAVKDGEEAINFLHQVTPFDTAQRPDLILLDINLPKKTGYEVLKEIRNTPNLKEIPVIVLTSSKADQDVALSYKLQANSYLVKPPTLSDFNELIKQIEGFWFNVVKLRK